MITIGSPLDSPLAFAWFLASFVGFVWVFVVAYRFNRTDYRDSDAKAIIWAALLACIWPLTTLAWFVGRERFRTPFSPTLAPIGSYVPRCLGAQEPNGCDRVITETASPHGLASNNLGVEPGAVRRAARPFAKLVEHVFGNLGDRFLFCSCPHRRRGVAVVDFDAHASLAPRGDRDPGRLWHGAMKVGADCIDGMLRERN